jgi:5'-3' exonuclease
MGIKGLFALFNDISINNNSLSTGNNSVSTNNNSSSTNHTIVPMLRHGIRKYDNWYELVHAETIHTRKNTLCVTFESTTLWSVKRNCKEGDKFIIKILFKIIECLTSGVIPIFVFDGKPPDEKLLLINMRRQKKHNINVRMHQLTNIMTYVKSISDVINYGQTDDASNNLSSDENDNDNSDDDSSTITKNGVSQMKLNEENEINSPDSDDIKFSWTLSSSSSSSDEDSDLHLHPSEKKYYKTSNVNNNVRDIIDDIMKRKKVVSSDSNANFNFSFDTSNDTSIDEETEYYPDKSSLINMKLLDEASFDDVPLCVTLFETQDQSTPDDSQIIQNVNPSSLNDYEKQLGLLQLEMERLKKQKILVTHEDINILKELLELLNLPYYTSENEADNLCVELYKRKYIDMCVSNDMDFLPRGCKKLIVLKAGKIILFDLDIILNEIKMSYDSFIDMCIIMGTDYRRKIVKLKNREIYESMLKYCTLEKFVDAYSDIMKHRDVNDSLKHSLNDSLNNPSNDSLNNPSDDSPKHSLNNTLNNTSNNTSNDSFKHSSNDSLNNPSDDSPKHSSNNISNNTSNNTSNESLHELPPFDLHMYQEQMLQAKEKLISTSEENTDFINIKISPIDKFKLYDFAHNNGCNDRALKKLMKSASIINKMIYSRSYTNYYK